MTATTSIRDVEWGSCLLERRSGTALEKQIRAETRRVAGGVVYLTSVPWVARAAAVLNNRLLTRAHVDHDLADLIGLVVSQDASCRYCFAATRALLLVLGYSPQRIAELEHGLITSEFTPRQRSAMEFARRLAHANPPPAEIDLEPLRRAGFSELAIKEIAALTSLYVFFNRLATLAALPPEPMERLPERWHVKLMAPLLRPRLRKLRRTASVEWLDEKRRSGPYAQAVIALDGLPVAAELRDVIDAMWESPVLSRRSKALAFGVVARALGDPVTEEESVRLAAANDLPRDAIDAALAHLGSPLFDPIEALTVPFARETIWYQVPPLQRRARELRAQLSEAQFAESIAVAALANTLCRVSALLAPR
jgi:AhpD family alkylhydroperoxidase